MEEFVACFSEVCDPRQENIRHNLHEVLLIALCTMLCGGEDCSDMEEFGRAKRPFLSQFLSLKHGIPSHDTFSRVFRRLDPKPFQACRNVSTTLIQPGSEFKLCCFVLCRAERDFAQTLAFQGSDRRRAWVRAALRDGSQWSRPMRRSADGGGDCRYRSRGQDGGRHETFRSIISKEHEPVIRRRFSAWAG